MEENKEQNDKEAQLLDNIDKDNLEEAELEDVLESVPPEHRKVIERMMISSSHHFYFYQNHIHQRHQSQRPQLYI